MGFEERLRGAGAFVERSVVVPGEAFPRFARWYLIAELDASHASKKGDHSMSNQDGAPNTPVEPVTTERLASLRVQAREGRELNPLDVPAVFAVLFAEIDALRAVVIQHVTAHAESIRLLEEGVQHLESTMRDLDASRAVVAAQAEVIAAADVMRHAHPNPHSTNANMRAAENRFDAARAALGAK